MSGIITSTLKSDFTAIDCGADRCTVEVEHTEESTAQISYSRGVSVYFKKSEGKLVIRRKKGLFLRIFKGEGSVKICVPGHIVPALYMSGEGVNCTVSDCIFKAVEFTAAGSFSAQDTAMESCIINTPYCNAYIKGCTIKGNFIANAESGGINLEYTFASHVACRIKRGNTGALELNCKDSIFETGEGNINATILGDESKYDVIVNAREGICNRESVNIENEEGSFKAYAAKGNIVVDFIAAKEN